MLNSLSSLCEITCLNWLIFWLVFTRPTTCPSLWPSIRLCSRERMHCRTKIPMSNLSEPLLQAKDHRSQLRDHQQQHGACRERKIPSAEIRPSWVFSSRIVKLLH